jgi:outer membrane protein assembly factor BamB
VYALEIASGKLMWKAHVGGVVTAPPVIANGVVCIQAGGTFAFDISSGKEAWRAGVGGAVQSVPVLTKDGMYVSSLDGEVYALE